MTRAVVVGGGLAGLAAARRLADRDVDVMLFERRDEVGGRVRSTREDGFVYDRGFQVLFTAYPSVRSELDLSALALRSFAPGATIARPGHRSTLSDPIRDPRSLFPTLASGDASLPDKLRVARLRRELRRTDEREILDGDDRTIREYLRRRGFSDRFVEHFAAPLYGGITLDRSLSTSSVVFEYTFRAMATGKIAVPADGMGAIPAQLAETARDAGATVETDATVESVATTGDEATVTVGDETITADAVVVATDPPTARDLTGVAAVPTEGRGCVTQYFAAPERRTLDTGRRLLLNAADDRPNHVAPLSAVAPEYAPDGRQLFAATFLGTPDASEEALADSVRQALSSWYPKHRFDDLTLRHTARVAFAQFAQPPGFRATLPTVDAPDGPVYLAGDYTQWSSIHGALTSGRVAAERV
ncbi:MAG: NAD(P)/FAD-dependent oxidoreductase [Haloarculaceae archaeon]